MQLDRPFLAITPTVDGDVLAALARVDAALTIRQLNSVIGRHSAEGIRKVVNRLAQQGIVTAEYVGGNGAFRLNRDHLLADVAITAANAWPMFLSRLRGEIEAWPVGVLVAAVFGSAARGEMRADSDIDLFIAYRDEPDDVPLHESASELQQQVHRWTGNWLSTIAMSQVEILERGDEPLLREVEREGIEVAGSMLWLRRHLRSVGSHAHT